MKYFSKLLSMFLVGAMLYSTGCTDYETDINNLKQDVDQIKQELNGQIDALKADLGADITALEGAIEAANNAIAANQTAIDGLKAADAAMDTRVKAAEEAIIKANADIAAANAAIAENADAIEENAKAIEAAKKSIADAVAAIEEANKAIEENADAIEALKLVDEEFAKDITALEENLATLETELKAYADDLFDESKEYTDAEIKKLNDSLTGALNAHIDAFTAYQAEVKGIIAALEARVAANEEAIAALEASVEELYELHDVQAQLIENLDGRFETFVEYTEQELQALRDADAALAALIAANTDYIKNVENALIDYQKIANEQFTKAFGLIADNLSKINALEAALEAEKTERIAMGKAIHEHIDNVQAELKDMIAKLDSKYAAEVKAIYAKYDAIVAELEAELENLEKALEAEKTERIAMGKALHEDINNVRDYLLDEVAKLDKQTKEQFDELTQTMNKKFEDVNTALGNMYVELQGKIKEVNDALEAYKKVVDGKLAEMSIQIDMLINRVQSIVYVPTTADHKAEVVSLYYKDANKKEFIVSEGFVEMTFRVTPASAAQQLVAYYNSQKDKSAPIFSLEPEEVRTRGEAPSFSINSIELDEKGNGRFIVNATPSLPAAYYEKQTSFSVALRLLKSHVEEGDFNADIVSDYVNLFPVREYTDGLVLVGTVKDVEGNDKEVVIRPNVLNDAAKYELEYASMAARAELLKGFEPRYVYKNENLTAEQLAELGFNVAPIETACTHVAYNKNGQKFEVIADANFEVYDAVEAECNEVVKLADEKKCVKETIGNHLDTDHVYTIAEGVDFNFLSCVTIVKEHRDANLANLWYKWNYTDFAAATAETECTDDSHYYTDWWGVKHHAWWITDCVTSGIYEGGSRAFVLKVKASDIPADILANGAEYVINNWGKDAKKLYVEAYTVAGDVKTKYEGLNVVPVAYDAEKQTWAVAVEGWKFNKAGEKYEIKAKYEFDALDIVFAFDAEFVNIIDLEYTHNKSVDFTYEIKNQFDGQLTDAENKPISIAEALVAKYPALVDVKDGEYGYFTNIEQLNEALKAINPIVNYDVVRTDARDAAAAETVITDKTQEFKNAYFSPYYSHLFVSNNVDMNGTVRILKSDVKSDFDKFAFTTSFAPKFENQTMNVTIKAAGSVKMPEIYIKHVDYVVKDMNQTVKEDDGKEYTYLYASDVVGLWDPNNLYESAVSAFTTQNVDLKSGFEVVHKDDKAINGYVVLTADELAALNVKLEFALAKEYAGISIAGKNTLSYMGAADYVRVNGTLMVDGIEKRGAFDTYNNHYRVNKYDPIKDFIVNENATISTAVASKDYTVSILKDIQLFDVRGRELIDNNSMNSVKPWVVGDGTNGFADGANAGTVFSLNKVTYKHFVHDENGMGVNFLDKYLEADGAILYFSNLNNLKLQKDIYVTVTVTVEYPWGQKSDSIKYRVTSEKIEAEPTTPDAE